MKKIIAVLLAIVAMIAVFSGCSGQKAEPTSGVDVDLTVLSSTMVYAEVANMVAEPESYVGKTIKMQGQYYAQYYELTSRYYHFVIIADATACCAQGLEFVWLGEHAYPTDYPKDKTEIELIGIFESYKEDGDTYYRVSTKEVGVL